MVERWMEKNVTDMPATDYPATGGSELVVGISDGGLPFAAIKDGKLIGFEIELAQRFGAHLGRKVRFSNIDFSGLIAAVQAGKVDMIVAAIFITDERKQSIIFPTLYEEGTKAFASKEHRRYDTAAEATLSRPFFTARGSFPAHPSGEAYLLLLTVSWPPADRSRDDPGTRLARWSVEAHGVARC